jgi:hypothetical protein
MSSLLSYTCHTVRVAAPAAVAFFVIPGLLGGEFVPEDWRFRTPVVVNAPRGQLCVLKFTRGIYLNSRRDFGDLRLVHRGREVAYLIEAAPDAPYEESSAHGAPHRASSPGGRGSDYLFDFGAPGIPQDLVRMDVGDRAFHREVQVMSSMDGGQWAQSTLAAVYRAGRHSSSTVTLKGTRDRFLLVHLIDHDDTPLDVRAIGVFTRERRLKFLSHGPGEYLLYSGNPFAEAPVYDLAIVLARGFKRSAATAALSAMGANPAYQPAQQSFERTVARRFVAKAAGVCVLVLGFGFWAVFAPRFNRLNCRHRYRRRRRRRSPPEETPIQAPAAAALSRAVSAGGD